MSDKWRLIAYSPKDNWQSTRLRGYLHEAQSEAMQLMSGLDYEFWLIERFDASQGVLPTYPDSKQLAEYVRLRYEQGHDVPDFWHGAKPWESKASTAPTPAGPRKPKPQLPLEVWRDKPEVDETDYMAAVRASCKGGGV